jgi:hypothetical protein
VLAGARHRARFDQRVEHRREAAGVGQLTHHLPARGAEAETQPDHGAIRHRQVDHPVREACCEGVASTLTLAEDDQVGSTGHPVRKRVADGVAGSSHGHSDGHPSRV